MANVKEIMAELGVVLTTIDSMDQDLSYDVATFIDQKIIDEDDISTYTLALQYANWAMTHPKEVKAQSRSETSRCCYRGSHWNLVGSAQTNTTDVPKNLTVLPCDACASEQYKFWSEGFVGDSNEPPRGRDDI